MQEMNDLYNDNYVYVQEKGESTHRQTIETFGIRQSINTLPNRKLLFSSKDDENNGLE